MFKQIIKIIWKQRRANGWLFAELLVVMGVLWIMMDVLLVDVHTKNLPLGFDISNTFRLKLGELNAKAPGYLPEEQRTTTAADDIYRLMDQIRLSPEVEDLCLTLYSNPYSIGEIGSSIWPMEGDTTLRAQIYIVRLVTPEYFNVFQVKDKEGNPILPQLDRATSSIVITADMEKRFFGNQDGKGRLVNVNGNEDVHVAAVSQSIRANDYQVSNPCFYRVLVGRDYQSTVNQYKARMEMSVRMKKDYTPAEMNRFLESISDRLKVNNIYVYGAKKYTEQRAEKIRSYINKANIRLSLMAFMMINVFFGIIGTFWLRTQYRRGEIGLRVALGSTRSGLVGFMNKEGLCLLLLTVPFILLFVVNVAFMDFLETSRLSLSFWRFLVVGSSSYLIMIIMICFGVWFPARQAATLPPAEALRYE